MTFSLPTVDAGESVALAVIGRPPKGRKLRSTVAASCEETGGQWVCVTHDDAFDSNLQRDSHARTHADCRWAWWCWTHGLEAP